MTKFELFVTAHLAFMVVALKQIAHMMPKAQEIKVTHEQKIDCNEWIYIPWILWNENMPTDPHKRKIITDIVDEWLRLSNGNHKRQNEN